MEHSWTVPLGLVLILLCPSQCLPRDCTLYDRFGENCQYDCHCVGYLCQPSGECEQDVCDKGWFGPACQYADLSYTNSTQSTPSYLRDGVDTICNSDPRAQSATITLTGQFPFTWFRMLVNDPGAMQQAFTLQFKNTSSPASAECGNMKTVLINDQTLDIYCDVPVTANQVVLTGDVAKSLCSLYISGGRNIVLRHDTWQATGTPYRYVDGSYFTCTSTTSNGTQKDARWGVTLLQPVKVNRYVLHNSQDKQQPDTHLRGFILTSFNQNGQQAFSYQDKDSVPRNVYTVTSPSTTFLVSQVNITATFNKPGAGVVLTLCEVEIFGDTVCPSGMYGRECENRCNCAGGTECLETGGCPAGCAIGYQGETCNKHCDLGKYGKDCSKDCSANCNVNDTEAGQSPCDHISGICIRGCQNGYHDQLCVSLADDEYSGLVIGLGVGIAFLVILLVVGAVVSVYCYRRKLRAAGVSGQRGRPGCDDVSMTRQDRAKSQAEDSNNLPRNATEDEATGNEDHSSRPTVQYGNADVVHYDLPTENVPTDNAYEEIIQNQSAVPRKWNDNGAYVNLRL